MVGFEQEGLRQGPLNRHWYALRFTIEHHRRTTQAINVSKDILYKHANFLNPTNKTLQEHLLAARKTLRLARNREQKFGEDQDIVRVWNASVKRGLLACGMFHSWENGRSQLILAMKVDAEEYPVVAADPPPTKDAKHTEFNEGLLFFGVHKNHVLLLQSAALRIGAFEDYLNWLLQDAVDEIGKENRVELADPLPKKLRDRDVPTLKSIILSPSIHAEPVQTTGRRPEGKQRVKEMRMQLRPADWEPIRDLMRNMGADVPKELRLDGDFKPERLQVNIELKWLGRKKDRAETPMLDAVLRAFRDVDNPPIRATTVDGEILDGNDLRLKKTVNLKVDGKIPVAGDVFERMAEYLAELMKRGDIPLE